MESQFTFFKAGQGLFYGGRICMPETGQVFTVVYDCGTSPFIDGNNKSLNDEINHFKFRFPFFRLDKNIELLFISHLDYDHVSGLKRLLEEFRVRRIILPYIEKKYRQFFLTSISDDNDPDDNLTIDEYISFIESPNQFIENNSSNKIMQYYIKPNEDTEIIYQGYDVNQSDDIYPKGTPITDIIDTEISELISRPNVFMYENDLQFFIKRYWEFTTFTKSININAINELHSCLKKNFKIKEIDYLTFQDLKDVVTSHRKKSHKCYTNYVDDINSHGLVLLHGPIRILYLCSSIRSNCELDYSHNEYHNHNRLHEEDNSMSMLGTLLFGDTSINPANNPIRFPLAFRDKLVNVHVVQVPHHGSSKNWDFTEFEALKIGININRWRHRVVAVCNFGYGNKFGHPSGQILRDLSSTIFLNSQFSRLNICYAFIDFRP